MSERMKSTKTGKGCKGGFWFLKRYQRMVNAPTKKAEDKAEIDRKSKLAKRKRKTKRKGAKEDRVKAKPEEVGEKRKRGRRKKSKSLPATPAPAAIAAAAPAAPYIDAVFRNSSRNHFLLCFWGG